MLAVAKKLLVLNDGAQHRDGIDFAQTSERLNRFQLHERRPVLSSTGGREGDQVGAGSAILAHTDLIDCLRQNERIEQLQEFKQRATAVWGCAVRNLTDDYVLIETIELAHTPGQQFQKIGNRETAQ